MSSKDLDQQGAVPPLKVVRTGDAVKRSWSDLVGSGIPTPSPDSKNAPEAVLAPLPRPTQLIEAIGGIICSDELPGGSSRTYRLSGVDEYRGEWVLRLSEVPSAATYERSMFEQEHHKPEPEILHAVIQNFRLIFKSSDSFRGCPLIPGDEVLFVPKSVLSQEEVHPNRLNALLQELSGLTSLIGEVEEVDYRYGLVKVKVFDQSYSSNSLVRMRYPTYVGRWYARETLALIRRPVPLESVPNTVVLTYSFLSAGGEHAPGQDTLGSVYEVRGHSATFFGDIPARVYVLAGPLGRYFSVPEHAVSMSNVTLLSSTGRASDVDCSFYVGPTRALRMNAASRGTNSKSLSGKISGYLAREEWWAGTDADSRYLTYSEVSGGGGDGSLIQVADIGMGTMVRIVPVDLQDIRQEYPIPLTSVQSFIDRNSLTRGVVVAVEGVDFSNKTPQVLCANGRILPIPACHLTVEGYITNYGFGRYSSYADLRRGCPDSDSPSNSITVTLVGACGSKDARIIDVAKGRSRHIDDFLTPDSLEYIQNLLELSGDVLAKRVTPEEAVQIDSQHVTVDNSDGTVSVVNCLFDYYPSRLYKKDHREINCVLMYSCVGSGSGSEVSDEVLTDLAWISQIRLDAGDAMSPNAGTTPVDLSRIIDTAILTGLGEEERNG